MQSQLASPSQLGSRGSHRQRGSTGSTSRTQISSSGQFSHVGTTSQNSNGTQVSVQQPFSIAGVVPSEHLGGISPHSTVNGSQLTSTT